jgi:hypothetical protein
LDERAREAEFYFLPDRNFPDASDGSGGFLATVASYGLRLWYLADTSTTLGNWWDFAIDNASETTNNFFLQPIESTAGTHYLSIVRYRFAVEDLVLVQATDPYSIGLFFSTSLSSQLAGYGTAPVTAAGTNIYPDSDADDLQYFLVKGSTGLYSEVACNTSESTAASIIGSLGPIGFDLDTLPEGLEGAFYAHDPGSDASYLSYWSDDDRRYRSYTWTASSAPAGLQELPDIEDRVDAVLTSGELLSFADGACTVYSSAGARLYRFPLGGLRFCYERYDPLGAEFKLYFSLAYWVFEKDDSEGRLFVEVYAIPTANLADLD